MKNHKVLSILVLFGVLASGLAQAEVTEKIIEQKRKGYPVALTELDEYRKKQAERYRGANAESKAVILAETRKHLEDKLLHEIFPAWYGTDWAFHGTTTKPGEGAVACGYFVSTCLLHAGFKVERIKLAQQASQTIIETFMAKADRDILAGGKSMKAIREYLRKEGNGIYIVGLDLHVGFISVSGENMAFIHSSYYEPESFVKSEKIDSKNPLSDSQYRVFGKIFSDEMMVGWLTEKKYSVK
ncbi:MAG: hypothetical protein V4727_09085 [Verrucomicrobiota bacterium]